jgi:coenzyme F420-0:L-glutamate ligase/coenzyme F420-1:gamma-L-glutamate ligase
LVALGDVPLVREGDDLCEIILTALARSGETLLSGDIVVLAQKVVSKAHGRYVELASVTPSARALELAKVVEKDPRLIELILGESSEVLRIRRDVVVVVHRLGFVMANAGIDFSNAEANETRTATASDWDGNCKSASARASGSSSTTATAAPGATAPWELPSGRAAFRHCSICAASPIYSDARLRLRKSAWPTSWPPRPRW